MQSGADQHDEAAAAAAAGQDGWQVATGSGGGRHGGRRRGRGKGKGGGADHEDEDLRVELFAIGGREVMRDRTTQAARIERETIESGGRVATRRIGRAVNRARKQLHERARAAGQAYAITLNGAAAMDEYASFEDLAVAAAVAGPSGSAATGSGDGLASAAGSHKAALEAAQAAQAAVQARSPQPSIGESESVADKWRSAEDTATTSSAPAAALAAAVAGGKWCASAGLQRRAIETLQRAASHAQTLATERGGVATTEGRAVLRVLARSLALAAESYDDLAETANAAELRRAAAAVIGRIEAAERGTSSTTDTPTKDEEADEDEDEDDDDDNDEEEDEEEDEAPAAAAASATAAAAASDEADSDGPGPEPADEGVPAEMAAALAGDWATALQPLRRGLRRSGAGPAPADEWEVLRRPHASTGATMLMIAAGTGALGPLRMLVSAGVPLAAVDRAGASALWWALRWRRNECARALLQSIATGAPAGSAGAIGAARRALEGCLGSTAASVPTPPPLPLDVVVAVHSWIASVAHSSADTPASELPPLRIPDAPPAAVVADAHHADTASRHEAERPPFVPSAAPSAQSMHVLSHTTHHPHDPHHHPHPAVPSAVPRAGGVWGRKPATVTGSK